MNVHFKINDIVIPAAEIFDPFIKAVVDKFGDAGIDPELLKEVIEQLQGIEADRQVSPAAAVKLQEYATYFCALAMMKNVTEAQFVLTDEIEIDVF